MKRKFDHSAPANSESLATGPRYWRSLDDLAANPAVQDILKMLEDKADD